jgi:hypothetical protein
LEGMLSLLMKDNIAIHCNTVILFIVQPYVHTVVQEYRTEGKYG